MVVVERDQQLSRGPYKAIHRIDKTRRKSMPRAIAASDDVVHGHGGHTGLSNWLLCRCCCCLSAVITLDSPILLFSLIPVIYLSITIAALCTVVRSPYRLRNKHFFFLLHHHTRRNISIKGGHDEWNQARVECKRYSSLIKVVPLHLLMRKDANTTQFANTTTISFHLLSLK